MGGRQAAEGRGSHDQLLVAPCPGALCSAGPSRLLNHDPRGPPSALGDLLPLLLLIRGGEEALEFSGDGGRDGGFCALLFRGAELRCEADVLLGPVLLIGHLPHQPKGKGVSSA